MGAATSRLQLDRVSGDEAEPEFLRDGRHSSTISIIANALRCTRAGRRRKGICILWQVVDKFWRPRSGLNSSGASKNRYRDALPSRHKNLHTRRNVITSRFRTLRHFTANDISRRVEPHGLLRHHLCKFQSRPTSAASGALPSSTSSRSCRVLVSASGCCASRYHAQVSVRAVVSCPARNR